MGKSHLWELISLKIAKSKTQFLNFVNKVIINKLLPRTQDSRQHL
jgi:hypothetical protein